MAKRKIEPRDRLISWHEFCVKRMIPVEMEIRLLIWFKEYFDSKFVGIDDRIFEILVGRMYESEIQEYWKMYIKSLRDILPSEG